MLSLYAGERGGTVQRGIKGRKNWDHCNSIINKIYWKKKKNVVIVYEAQKVFSHVIWKIETFIEEETRNIVHRTIDTSVPFKVGTLGPHTVLPIAISCPVIFSESHWWSEISSLSKLISLLRKARSDRLPNLGWVTWVIWCFAKKHFTRCNAWAVMLFWWSCRSLVSHSCGLLNHWIISFCKGMFKLSAKFDADSLLYSLSHFECNGHTVHTFTQWCVTPPMTSTVRLSLFTHVYSSSLFLAARLHRCHINYSRYSKSV